MRGKYNTYRGGDGNYYFINAAEMAKWLNTRWGRAKVGHVIDTGVTFQTGLSGVSGHVGVIYKSDDGGSHVANYMDNISVTYYWCK